MLDAATTCKAEFENRIKSIGFGEFKKLKSFAQFILNLSTRHYDFTPVESPKDRVLPMAKVAENEDCYNREMSMQSPFRVRVRLKSQW
jgi:hypothetical protein